MGGRCLSVCAVVLAESSSIDCTVWIEHKFDLTSNQSSSAKLDFSHWHKTAANECVCVCVDVAMTRSGPEVVADQQLASRYTTRLLASS